VDFPQTGRGAAAATWMFRRRVALTQVWASLPPRGSSPRSAPLSQATPSAWCGGACRRTRNGPRASAATTGRWRERGVLDAAPSSGPRRRRDSFRGIYARHPRRRRDSSGSGYNFIDPTSLDPRRIASRRSIAPKASERSSAAPGTKRSAPSPPRSRRSPSARRKGGMSTRTDRPRRKGGHPRSTSAQHRSTSR